MSASAITNSGLAPWLQEQKISLALSTYRANRLIFIGVGLDGRLKIHERLFDRPMGLFATDQSLWMAGRSHLWRFDNLLSPQQSHEGADHLYVPAASFLTGDVSAHELIIDKNDSAIFVNTSFSCLAKLERGYSFNPIWHPPFIDALVPEDRCHLNGIALRNGVATWVTACNSGNKATSWRSERVGNGIAIHIPSGEIACAGLTMPHSPRWHNNRLWLLNSGTGELGWVENSQFHPLCQLPGFARGLILHGHYAFVGISKLRSEVFTGLPLEERLQTDKENPQGICGLQVIDLKTGEMIHSIRLPEPIDELFDLALLTGVREPRALGLSDENMNTLVKLPAQKELLRIRPNTPSTEQYKGPDVKHHGIPIANQVRHEAKKLKVKYQRIYQITPDNLAPYASLTYPPLATGSNALNRLKGSLFGISAMHNGVMVGLAIAECDKYFNAEIVSLMVTPERRKEGIGTKLVWNLSKLLAEENCKQICLRYQAQLHGNTTMKNLLKRLGWQIPRQELLLLKGESQQLARINWHKQFPLPEQYTITQWKQEYMAEAEYSQAPQELKDAIQSETAQIQTSLALLHNKQLAGWLITHRTSKNSLRYSSLFVENRHRQRGQALHPIARALSTQKQLEIPIARAGIAPESHAAIRLLKRHGLQHLAEIKQSMVSSLMLNKKQTSRRKTS